MGPSPDATTHFDAETTHSRYGKGSEKFETWHKAAPSARFHSCHGGRHRETVRGRPRPSKLSPRPIRFATGYHWLQPRASIKAPYFFASYDNKMDCLRRALDDPTLRRSRGVRATRGALARWEERWCDASALTRVAATLRGVAYGCRCSRSPWGPTIMMSSTGPSRAPNQCGVQVVNSTASPGSMTKDSSPSSSRRRPSRT